MAAERAFVRQLEAVAPGTLSATAAFERELALHSARLRLFSDEVVRGWERTSNATDEIGTAIFLLSARDFAPLEERLVSMTRRVEGIPAALAQVRDRLGPDPVRLWHNSQTCRAISRLFPMFYLSVDGIADAVTALVAARHAGQAA